MVCPLAGNSRQASSATLRWAGCKPFVHNTSALDAHHQLALAASIVGPLHQPPRTRLKQGGYALSTCCRISCAIWRLAGCLSPKTHNKGSTFQPLHPMSELQILHHSPESPKQTTSMVEGFSPILIFAEFGESQQPSLRSCSQQRLFNTGLGRSKKQNATNQHATFYAPPS
jgi:hypothetical protein